MPSAVPDAVPDVVPDVMPEVVPEVAPDVLPDELLIFSGRAAAGEVPGSNFFSGRAAGAGCAR